MSLEPTMLQEVLGYLNFSSGKPDPRLLGNLNALYQSAEDTAADGQAPEPTIQSVRKQLQAKLDTLAGAPGAFENVEQIRAVLPLVFDLLPAAYRRFHRDLLFHESDAEIWRPFFLARACEAVLAQGSPWDETERILDGAIAQLNDFVGHRPVAVLRTSQRIEPYPHEWLRPVPLYVREAGVACGRYAEIVTQALEILRATDPALLREAQFDPVRLDELAFDPRAYDFDHPVNKRPNYHFGQWDPHHIDGQGFYDRFVVQQVTLDVLLSRVDQPGDLPREELLAEAAAVLAGTMLMASGTSGAGPDAYDSSTTLTTLMPRIAAYRDAFYEAYIRLQSGQHGERLRAEAVTGKQPLAGARQHLNQQLARRRASQLEHLHLALLFARIGFPEAALRQAHVVPVPSARMLCEIHCRLTAGHQAIDAGQLSRAWTTLGEIEDFLHRGIECGALADPWSILGFQGQFSLFPSPENSVPDHRIDQLIELMEQILALYARLWSEAAGGAHGSMTAQLSRTMQSLTQWWDQFAPTSVEGIESFSGVEAYDSAREVAGALADFRQAGAAAGDIGFWRKHVAHFKSPKAYALVVGALLEKPDLVAAMALLMQWLSQAESIPLKQQEYSFHTLAERWLAEVLSCEMPLAADGANQREPLIRRFFELLEANAEDFWQVPRLELLGAPPGPKSLDDTDNSDEDEDSDGTPSGDLYSAAYDDVVYVDSTADGIEADMLEAGGAAATDFELDLEANRVSDRLAFLRTVAGLWKTAAMPRANGRRSLLPRVVLEGWLTQATALEAELVGLLASVDRRRIPAPTASRDSLLEFDRRRSVKETLAEKIVVTAVDVTAAARAVRAALASDLPDAVSEENKSGDALDRLLAAIVRGDGDEARACWPEFLEGVRTRPILYVPLSRRGDPTHMAQARVLQQTLRDLVTWLPRLGLLRETCQLLETARMMETTNPVGTGAISEYDRLFNAGYEALVEALVDVSSAWGDGDAEKADNLLVESLEQLTESLLRQWLAHSRTLRLSVLERISNDKAWQALVAFIERYGKDLFTQRFLHRGNLRAILHQGVDSWLAQLESQTEDSEPLLVVQDLGDKLPRADAVKHLGVIIEAVAENYGEYLDYNGTTTQSDRGDLLYTLLDFLRLRVHYDRVAWHLKPVLAAHAILMRRGRSGAAEAWRRALADRTGELADTLQKKYQELRKRYGMRLPTVGDRVGERFIRPLAVDRVRALVKPAMDEARNVAADSTERACAFELLEQEAEELAQEPTGVGLDVPPWLAALEQEVDTERRRSARLEPPVAEQAWLRQAPLDVEGVQRQLTGWEQHPH